MDVTLPNGKVIKGVPEGTPKDAIMQKAIASGLATQADFEQATKQNIKSSEKVEEKGFFKTISDAFTGEGKTTEELEGLPDIGDAPELNEMSVRAFKTALGQMTTGKTKELKSIFKEQYGDSVSFREDAKGNTIVKFPSGEYPLNRPGFSAQDVPKLIADIAAFTPAGRARSIGGAAVKSGATEAAIEGVEAGVGGEFSPEDVGAATVLGGALKGVEDAAGTGYRALRGRFSPQQQQAVEEAAEAGIPMMTSDVFPPQTFAGKVAQQTGEKIPLAGTASAREGQQEIRASAVDRFREQFGDFSYDAVIQGIRNKGQRVRGAAANTLERSGAQLDELGDVAIDNTRRTINQVNDELARPGVIGSERALRDLEELSEVILNNPQTYTSLRENRTAFREIVDSLDPTSRSQLTSRAKSLLRSVERSMTDDMMGFARNNLSANEFRQLQSANRVYAREAQNLKNTRLKNILDKGDFTPENVKQMLFSQKPSEMQSLFRSLNTEGRQNARAAIINKIVTDLSKRQSGLTPNSFASELKKYGPQIQTFFKGADRRALEGLRRGLEATRRAQDASITTPTGQSMVGGLTGWAAFTDLGATLGLGGTAGGLARLYESAPVRNALIRLAGTRKGSTAFEEALSQANEALSVAAQVIRSEQQDKE